MDPCLVHTRPGTVVCGNPRAVKVLLFVVVVARWCLFFLSGFEAPWVSNPTVSSRVCAIPTVLRFSYLGEANVVGLLTEALTADVEAVLADETSRVGADTAKQRRRKRG